MHKTRVFLVICLVGLAAQAGFAVPYTADSHTLHLYHFDGNTNDSVATNPIHLGLDSGATMVDTALPGLGQALYTYEGTAATNQNLPSAMATPEVAIRNFVGSDGTFTFEALVCPAFGLGAMPNNMQIISGEHNSSRGWQFRVESAGNLTFINLTGTIQTIATPLPKDGPHAFVANKWFHAAVTYNGQANTDGNLKLYWTALDSGVSEAYLLGSFRMTADLDPAVAPFFVIGNEGRNSNGRTENWEGWIDEVRISDIARSVDGMSPFVDKGAALSPVPANNTADVPHDVVLSWTPGESAVTGDVYFGTSADDVANASASSPLGVLVSQGQDANTYDAGRLEFGRTYYWRVDGVSAAPSLTISSGRVWSFTIEPYSYPITTVTATASSSSKNAGPEKTVDRSGLNANDQHSVTMTDMWLSARDAAEPAWIQYAFDKTRKLDKMLVWNSNMVMESSAGVGAKDVTIEYSTDGATWTALGDFVFPQAPGQSVYAAGAAIDFGGAAASLVRLTIKSNWGGAIKQYSLSEVRFYGIPAAATQPSPAAGTTGVYPQVMLGWRSGREAASHEVYISDNEQAVIDGTAPTATVAEPAYDAALNLGKTWFWKVVEINTAESVSTWEGDVWSFSTAESIVIDDFESYTNESPRRVFQTWIDGIGFSEDEFFPNGNTGNGSGAMVGYDPAKGNIMETAVIHGGKQSIPLYYDNSANPHYAETQRTFTTPQDWTKHGITTLVLHFHGDPNNAPAPLYVKINDKKVLYDNGAAATASSVWKQWNISLSGVAGVNLKSVKTLAIGVGDGSGGGTGTVYIDDILLYAAAPTVATSVLPKDLGNTNQNWLGRSQWPTDAFFTGALDDFRIYARVLSESEVRYLAGDR